MKDESGSSESVAVAAVAIGFVIAVLVYTVAVVVAIVVKLLLWTLLFAAVAAPVYFLIKQTRASREILIKQTRASREIEANLSKVLAQVEGQEPIEVLPALSSASVEWQESVLTDSEWWGLEMRFVRETEDGKIRTTVRLEHERATVTMLLNGIELKGLNYSKYGQNINNQKQCPEAVRHVREWMRWRILPELEAAKTRRESESRRLEAERHAQLEEERRKGEEYRRKYLP